MDELLVFGLVLGLMAIGRAFTYLAVFMLFLAFFILYAIVYSAVLLVRLALYLYRREHA
jgi:hypothetical protein